MANQGYGNFESDAPVGKGPVANEKRELKEQPSLAEGPHAKPDLTNHAATPGSGAMPEGPAAGGDSDPGTG